MKTLVKVVVLSALIFATTAVGYGRAAPRVVVSIMPIHSLVAGVMDGIGAPTLLVKGGASPHSYAMKPSEARQLRDADRVFWIGEALESFLSKTLNARAYKDRAVALAKAEGVGLIPIRGADDKRHHAGHHHGDSAHNMHLWLDPLNAKAMIVAIGRALTEADPKNSARYRANAKTLRGRLDALDAALRRDMAPVGTTPYVVFHDAYAYFERRYGLNNVGAVTVSPEARPGAKRVYAMRETVRSAGAVCVFSEPQFEPALIRTIVRGTKARTGSLDPLGAALKPGKDAYFTLLRNLANSFRRCLQRPG